MAERIDFERSNLDFLHSVVVLALDGGSDDEKSAGRDFLKLVNKGEVVFSPAMNTISVGSRKMLDDKIVVFVPFPFVDFLGHQDSNKVIFPDLKKALSLDRK